MTITKRYLNMDVLEIIIKNNINSPKNSESKSESKVLVLLKLWTWFKTTWIEMQRKNGQRYLKWLVKKNYLISTIKLHILYFLMICQIIFTQSSNHLRVKKNIWEFGVAQLSQTQFVIQSYKIWILLNKIRLNLLKNKSNK